MCYRAVHLQCVGPALSFVFAYLRRVCFEPESPLTLLNFSFIEVLTFPIELHLSLFVI
uniref:Uncharacterized protein n=1 Tax=Anguilla anguilla TaxID=7936 RepID=A0A0E9R4E4_ANGAN